jgi:hypothetical protein
MADRTQWRIERNGGSNVMADRTRWRIERDGGSNVMADRTAAPVTLEKRMRSLRCLLLLPAFLFVGCHSPFVEATVSNRTSQTLELIEVDYPSASFGTQSLAAGADFHYRFKVLGEGKLKLTYTDAAHHDQKSEGFLLKEGAEGPIHITIAPDGAKWQNSTTTH